MNHVIHTSEVAGLLRFERPCNSLADLTAPMSSVAYARIAHHLAADLTRVLGKALRHSAYHAPTSRSSATWDVLPPFHAIAASRLSKMGK